MDLAMAWSEAAGVTVAPDMMSPTATEAVAEWAVEGAGGNEEAKGSGVTLVMWRSMLVAWNDTRNHVGKCTDQFRA